MNQAQMRKPKKKVAAGVTVVLALLVLVVVAVCYNPSLPQVGGTERIRPPGDYPARLVQSLTGKQLTSLREQHFLWYYQLDPSQQAIMNQIVKTTQPGDTRFHRNKPPVWHLEYEPGWHSRVWLVTPIWHHGRDHPLYVQSEPDPTPLWHRDFRTPHFPINVGMER